HLFEGFGVRSHLVTVDQQNGLELDGLSRRRRDPVRDDDVADGNLLLTAAGLDDRVDHVLAHLCHWLIWAPLRFASTRHSRMSRPPLGAHGGTVRGAPPSKITRERPRGANHTSVTWVSPVTAGSRMLRRPRPAVTGPVGRSEEHTSELQSRFDLVCRLLLEKKKNI